MHLSVFLSIYGFNVLFNCQRDLTKIVPECVKSSRESPFLSVGQGLGNMQPMHIVSIIFYHFPCSSVRRVTSSAAPAGPGSPGVQSADSCSRYGDFILEF